MNGRASGAAFCGRFSLETILTGSQNPIVAVCEQTAVVDLRDWITSEHESVAGRFLDSIVASVPLERWREHADGGGSSIAFLTFHVAYHEDVAVNAVLGGGEPLLQTRRDHLGLGGLAPHVGLAESEPPELTAALDLEQLLAYSDAVHDTTATWLGDLEPSTLDASPEPAAALAHAGVDEGEVPWLYKMWTGRPASWFVQWEAIGHRVNHVGEMVSVRNRMGLSPF